MYAALIPRGMLLWYPTSRKGREKWGTRLNLHRRPSMYVGIYRRADRVRGLPQIYAVEAERQAVVMGQGACAAGKNENHHNKNKGAARGVFWARREDRASPSPRSYGERVGVRGLTASPDRVESPLIPTFSP